MAAFSTSNILNRYIPLAGGASALAFSVNVMEPSLFKSLFSPNELLLTNSLWFNAHLGLGIHLYRKDHMKSVSQAKRVTYAVFGTMMFNFGSVLFWATAKTLLPKCRTVRILFGLGSGVALLLVGESYLRHIDSQLALPAPEPTSS